MSTTRIGDRIDPEVTWGKEHGVGPEVEPISKLDGCSPSYDGGVLVDIQPGNEAVPIFSLNRRCATALMFRLAHSLGLHIEIRPRAFYPAPLMGRR